MNKKKMLPVPPAHWKPRNYRLRNAIYGNTQTVADATNIRICRINENIQID